MAKTITLSVDLYGADDKMKLIEGLPSRDTLHYIWIRFLMLAAKADMDGTIPYIPEQLAVLVGRDKETVYGAITVFQKLEMVEALTNGIYIVGAAKKKKKVSEPKADKLQYADYVLLTKEEYDKLCGEYGEPFTKKCIETLSNYKGSSGKTYKSDNLAMRNWVVDRVAEKMPMKKSEPAGRQANDFLSQYGFRGNN